MVTICAKLKAFAYKYRKVTKIRKEILIKKFSYYLRNPKSSEYLSDISYHRSWTLWFFSDLILKLQTFCINFREDNKR